MSTALNQNNNNPYQSVHASAGSGKTYELISQIVRLLILGAQPSSILAITFTRKAASEMQERLLERVHRLATCSHKQLLEMFAKEFKLAADESNIDCARNLYESLLHNYQKVRTTTFHAFCQDLLRRFPMEAEIPPGFDLVDRTGYLIDEAWANLENELTRDLTHPDAEHFDSLLTQLGTSETRSLLDKFIAARSEWWAISSSPGFSIEQYCAQLAAKLAVNENEDLIKGYFSDQLNIKRLQQFHALLGKHAIKSNQEAQQFIEAALDEQNELHRRLENVWLAFFTKTNNTVRARKRNDTLVKKLGESDTDTFLSLHETHAQRLVKLKQQLHAQETISMTRAWLHAGNAFIKHYQAIKQYHRHLDFSDLEWQCYQLLNTSDHADWIQYKLDQRIDHLLVDEFQDTNQTQWQLLLPLLQELAASKQDRLRSVLFVGDSKQSIYRFRRAEPKLFAAATNWIEKNLAAEKKYLTSSYRSSPAIINFVNKLFINNPVSQLDDFQVHTTNKHELPGAVELLPLSIKDNRKPEPATELRNPLHRPLTTSESIHLQEASIAASRISELIDSETRIVINDKARPIQYGDIMILLRNRTHAAEYEQALREAHIPYTGTERGTLLESLEIKDMVNLLQWLITPFNNHALAGVLRSPLFSATESDLYPLVGKANWFDAILEQYSELDKTTPLARAAHHLQNWRELTDILPVHDLLDRIYSEGNVLARYQANYPDHLHARVHANLTRFIELALENDSGRYPSLTRFLGWLSLLRQQDQEAPDQPASSSDKNRVRILTIHESKGLESPVVLLLDATTSKQNRGGTSVLIDWPCDIGDGNEQGQFNQPRDFLISPSSPYPNPYCETLLQAQEEKEQQEEANLLYVAVTRAQQYLYISGSGKPAGWYENICQQYEIDPQETTEIQTLEAHEGTTPASVEKSVAEIETIAPDPRLEQPIKIKNRFLEIAPSNLLQEAMQTDHTMTADRSNTEPRIDSRQRGILIHLMIENLTKQANLGFSEFCRRNFLNESDDKLTNYWQQVEQCITTFPEFFEAEQYTQAYSEVPVTYKKGDLIVNGIIDRLVIRNDEAIIIDYKSHQVQDVQQLDKLAAQFRPQLSLYKDGVVMLYPDKQIKTYVIFTAVPACIEV